MSVCGNPESISVLILDGENELDTVKVLRCLNESRGLTVHILSASRLPLSRLSRHHAHLHRHSSQNDDEWTDAIEKVARRLKIDVILPATLEGIRLVSQRREAISKVAAIPPIPEFKTLELVRNKWSLYRFAKQHGLPVVPSVFVGRPREPIADSSDLASIEYPALLKPIVSSGGTGIVKVRTPCDLHAAWENKRIMEGSEYMLQSCIPGLDISFSVLCQGGEVKAHTIWRQLLPSRRPFCAVPLVEYTDDKEAVDVGKRLALWALAKNYGQSEIVYSGPLYKSVEIRAGKIEISFDHVGSGLKTRDGNAPDLFEIAGSDKVFYAASAKIVGDKVLVWSEKVGEPTAVRFAWSEIAEPNLMNKDGLPASSFRINMP